MSVTWNKKMRKTAGYCITGQERGGGRRYARIELSEKVCDSAGRALFKPDRLNNKLSAVDMHCHLFCIVNTFSSSLSHCCLPSPRSSQRHTYSWDVSRCDLADQWCEGRPRELLEAVCSQIHVGASRAAHGHPLPQLWHQVQIPVQVHPLSEYVRLTDFRCFKTSYCSYLFCVYTGCCVYLSHGSSQDRTSFQVAGHAEVRVRPLHRTTGLADAFQATCSHTLRQFCQRELWDCSTGASGTKPCGSYA